MTSYASFDDFRELVLATDPYAIKAPARIAPSCLPAARMAALTSKA